MSIIAEMNAKLFPKIDPVLGLFSSSVNALVNFNVGEDGKNKPKSTAPEPVDEPKPLEKDQVENLIETMQVGRGERAKAENAFQQTHEKWSDLRNSISTPLMIGGFAGLMMATTPLVVGAAVYATFGGIMAVGAAVRSYSIKKDKEHASRSNDVQQSNKLYDAQEIEAHARLRQIKEEPNAEPIVLMAQHTSLAKENQDLHDKVYARAAAEDKRGGQVLTGAAMLGLGFNGYVKLATSHLHTFSNLLIYGGAEILATNRLIHAGDNQENQKRQAEVTRTFFEGQQGLDNNFSKKVLDSTKQDLAQSDNSPSSNGFFNNMKKMGM